MSGQDMEIPEDGGTTYYQPQYEPMSPAVRGMPANSRGARGALEASSLLDLGALASANGMTRAHVTGLLDDFQEAALNAILSAAPKLLRRNREIAQSRINEIAARVNQLRRIQLAQPQTGVRALLGLPPNLALQQAQMDAPMYVSLVEVQLILNEAIAALTSREQ
jgi:hypothetical protein